MGSGNGMGQSGDSDFYQGGDGTSLLQPTNPSTGDGAAPTGVLHLNSSTDDGGDDDGTDLLDDSASDSGASDLDDSASDSGSDSDSDSGSESGDDYDGDDAQSSDNANATPYAGSPYGGGSEDGPHVYHISEVYVLSTGQMKTLDRPELAASMPSSKPSNTLLSIPAISTGGMASGSVVPTDALFGFQGSSPSASAPIASASAPPSNSGVPNDAFFANLPSQNLNLATGAAQTGQTTQGQLPTSQPSGAPTGQISGLFD